jgi:hypothetical protein
MSVVVIVVVGVVVNGSLDLAAREIVLPAFLFHLAIQGAATEFRWDALDQSRARCWLRFLRKTGRNQSCQVGLQNMLTRF